MSIRSNFEWMFSGRTGVSRGKSTSRNTPRRLLVEQMEDRRLKAVIDLAAFDAAQGKIIFGADIGDFSGYSVSDVGDVNGDGFDDFLIGAKQADASGNTKYGAGESYVIFGAATLPATIDLANLGAAGITIFGADRLDFSGVVSSAGDVNGDGFDDIAIGASSADASDNKRSSAGDSYVIFGAASLPTSIDLSTLGQSGKPAGTTIFGADIGDRTGRSIGSAGDVNGDGFDDLIIGARYGDTPGNTKYNAGESYLIFGAASLPATIDLANLAVLGPTTGITLFGADIGDRSSNSVSSAGDVNGDGFDDLLIGGFYADALANAKSRAGDSYVIFGGSSLPATIDLATLGQLGKPGGITIFGADADDRSGLSVSCAGDVNGDGFDDFLIGARYADSPGNLKSNSGESYLIFGAASLPVTIDLANLDALGPTVGITILGADTGDQSGTSVSGAGDVNGDGFDDLLVAARRASGLGNAKYLSGDTYVIFGAPSLTTTIDLNNLDTPGSTRGITIFGADADDSSGYSVSGAGDVNGDGFSDFIIGSPHSDGIGNLESYAGESYIIFGGNGFTSSVTHLGTTASETLTGTASANTMVGGRGNDVIVGAGGADVLIGGQGNDAFVVSTTGFRRIFGGTGHDTLLIAGVGIQLDLTTIRDNRIQDIETIDITGSGNNTLSLNAREVLNLSSHSNTLIVRRDFGDIVNRGPGWTQLTNEIITGAAFEVFQLGAAKLKIQLVESFVDFGSPGYVETGSWVNSALIGFNGTTSRFANAANAAATWNAPSLTPGYYSIALYKTATAGKSTNAQVSIAHNGITEPTQTINLTTGPSGFVTLGTFFFSGAPGEFVRLSQGTTVANLRADAVRFSRIAVANAPPTINAPSTQTVLGNATHVFSTANANAITVADLDTGLAQVQLVLSATNGLVTLASTSGLTFTSGANGQASFTVRGTLVNLNSALNGLIYQPNLNFTGNTSIQLTLNDLGNTGTGGAKSTSHSIALTVSSPIFIVDNGTAGYVESGTWLPTSATGFNGSTTRFTSFNNAIATWNAPTLAPGYYSVAIWRVASTLNSIGANVTIVHNGTTEPIQTINFSAAPTGFVELGTFYFNGAPGEFVRLSQGTAVGVLRADSVRFTRLPVANATPTIVAPSTQTVAGNTARAFSTANANAITVADFDAGLAQVQLTISATSGLLTLPSTAGLTFASGVNGQASFTVRGTVSSLNTALNGLSYQPNLNFAGSASIQLTLNDLGNTGTGGAKSASASIALTVNSPNFVVDNGTPGYIETGAWVNSALTGFNGTSTRFATAANAVATWNAPTLAPGFYSVAIWRVASASNSNNARVTIVHNGITESPLTVDLSTTNSGFFELGTFFFSGSPGEQIRLSQGTTLGNLRADSVRFTKLP